MYLLKSIPKVEKSRKKNLVKILFIKLCFHVSIVTHSTTFAHLTAAGAYKDHDNHPSQQF